MKEVSLTTKEIFDMAYEEWTNCSEKEWESVREFWCQLLEQGEVIRPHGTKIIWKKGV